MKKFILFFLSLFYSGIFIAQAFGTHQVAITPTAAPISDFDKEAYKKKLRGKFDREPNQKLLEEYIEDSAIGMDYYFASSDIYTNWDQATNYVKKVFQTAVPKEYATNGIKIYVVKDPIPNAFCMEDGNISVTVGYLSFMNSEAELAASLSHEFGHYYSNHHYTEFKNKNKNKVLKGLARGSFLGSLLVAENASTYQQEQERQADGFAFQFFTSNGYSPEAIVDQFKNFQEVQDKYKKLVNYRRPLIYFSTHPSNEERINNARLAFAGKNISGKKFQVDSLEFFNLRRRAIDETIYLFFEQMQYEECLEMAYREYLFHPADEFYLFFITECLRRQKVFEPSFDEDLFITGNYKNLSTKPARHLPGSLKGPYAGELNEKNYSKSVYTNLQSEIYNLSDQDVKAIKAPEILNQEPLEFLFNGDAFAYFSSKIPASACVFNLQRLILGQPLTGICNGVKGPGELEGDYIRAVRDYKTFLQNGSSYQKAPVIFFSLKMTRTTGTSRGEFYDPSVFDELASAYETVAAGFPQERIDAQNKFNFRERRKIESTSQFINALGLRSTFKKKSKTDFLSVFPEFSSEINKFNYSRLIFLEVTVSNPAAPGEGGMAAMLETWTYAIYTVDLINKEMVRTLGQSMSMFGRSLTREEKISRMLNNCVKTTNPTKE